MSIVRTYNKNAVAFLALLALILSGISPFCSSRALSNDVVEICTAAGMKLVDLNTGKPVSDDEHPSKTLSNDQCAYCFSAHQASILPSNNSNIAAAATKTPDQNILNDTILAASYAWRYEARAPPYTS